MATRHTKKAIQNTPRLQHGRHIKVPPSSPNPRAALQARVERRAEEQAQERRRVAQEAQEGAAEGRARTRANVERQAVYMAGQRGLDSVATTKLVNSTLAAFDRDPEPQKFRVHDVIRDKLTATGHGLRVDSAANPLDAASRPLPPARSDSAANAPPPGIAHHDAERAEQARRAAERARRLEEQNRRDREAYREALARHGLLDPVNGYPSGGGTSGLGM